MNEEKAIDAILLSLLSIYHNTEDPTKPLLEYLNSDVTFHQIHDSFQRLNLPKEAREIINLLSYRGEMVKKDDDDDDMLEELWMGENEDKLNEIANKVQDMIDALESSGIKDDVVEDLKNTLSTITEDYEEDEEPCESADLEDDVVPIVVCLDNTGMEESFSVGIEYLFVECGEDEEGEITECIDEAVLIVVEDMLGNKKIVMKERFDISGVEKWIDWKEEKERIEEIKETKEEFVEKEDFNYYKAFEKIQEWKDVLGENMTIDIMRELVKKDSKYGNYDKYNDLTNKYYDNDYKNYKIRWKYD